MTTKQFAEFGTALAGRLGQYASRGALVYGTPIGDVLRGACFDGSSFGKDRFFVNVFVQPLYVPADDIVLSLGVRLRSDDGDLWMYGSPYLRERLETAFNSQAHACLERARTPAGVIAAATETLAFGTPVVRQYVAYSKARAGQVDSAQSDLRALVETLNLGIGWQRTMAENATELADLLGRGPAHAQRRMDAWQRETLAALRLAD